ncbi:MAG: GNAT family N-acetyltransferase [Gammaproteobacteria bacterium]|nr:GNAT family N-acetyltransferase [Gammaproteobacteria bacterium]
MLVERSAKLTDLGFINSCILYGARKGHYSFNAENPEMVKAMKSETRSVISDGLLSDKRRASASVFTLQHDRVGMLIMCEAMPDSRAYEIYALSVAKNHQHKGFGRQILDRLLEHFIYHDVHARCMPVSETMKKLLQCRGFVFYSEDGGFETYVKPGFDTCNVA